MAEEERPYGRSFFADDADSLASLGVAKRML